MPDAVSVSTLLVLLVVVVAGLKLAVTPEGKPLALKVTAPANPLIRVTLTVLVPLCPWFTVKAAGLADRPKSGCCATVSVMLEVWLKLPLVPVTVTVIIPRVAVAEALSVSTLLVPLVVVVTGLKPAVTPVGSPLALKVTAPAKLLRRVMVIVLVPLDP